MKILNYREQNPATNIVAIFDIYSEKTTETRRNIKLIKSKNGSHFLSFPSFCVVDEDTGEKKWTLLYEFSQEKQKEFVDAILDQLGPFVRGGIVKYNSKRY